MTHRAPEKHNDSNANAATTRDATQRKQPSHALTLKQKSKSTSATLRTQRRNALPKKQQQRATRRTTNLKNFRNTCDVRPARLEIVIIQTQMPQPSAMRPNEYDQHTCWRPKRITDDAAQAKLPTQAAMTPKMLRLTNH